MPELSTRTAYALAGAAGIATWMLAAAVSGRQEAWDAPIYWNAAYPAALAVSAVLGYLRPERSWRWPLMLFIGQFVAMVVRSEELGNLWPLGLALFGVLSLPGVAAARVGVWVRRRLEPE